MCLPVSHPPTCPKCMSNILKLTARVDTVLVTFPKRFHTMCECVAACQWSIHHVPDVYVTCKYCAQRVSSDNPAVFYHAISMRPPYIPPLWHHDDSIKAPSPAFSLSGINSQCWLPVQHLFLNVCAALNYGILPVCLVQEHYMSWYLLFREITNIISKIQHLNSKSPPRLWFFFLRLSGIYHQ